MDKIWIVLKSEFWRRVRSKWFIIMTILGPIILISLAVVPAVIGIFASESNRTSIAVIDETGVLFEGLVDNAENQFTITGVDWSRDVVRDSVISGVFDGYLLLPEAILTADIDASYYSVEGGGFSLGSRLERLVDRVVEEQQLIEHDAPPEILEILKTNISVRMVKLTEEGETADGTVLYSVVGYIMGFIIYFGMFMYGAYVMQGVMEEKQSRVVEVVVSCVKPFHLLMGKVLGIGAMGLVQMLAWGLFVLLGTTLAGGLVAIFLDPSDFNLPVDVSQDVLLSAADITIPALSPILFIWFILFFVGGYLLYSSLFAAIGSAVEQQQDTQGFLFPLSMLIIVPIMFISFLIESPNATLSVILSLIPFFSPILMVVRVAVTDVPIWQVILALLLLAGSFVGTIWISSRIYRIGILMYGKKPTLKDLARWFRYQ